MFVWAVQCGVPETTSTSGHVCGKRCSCCYLLYYIMTSFSLHNKASVKNKMAKHSKFVPSGSIADSFNRAVSLDVQLFTLFTSKQFTL